MGYTTAIASTVRLKPGWRLYRSIPKGPQAQGALRAAVAQAQSQGYVDLHADVGHGLQAAKQLYVNEATKGQGGGTGSGAGGAGGPGGPPAAAGVAPQITGGFESVEPEIVQNNVQLTERGPTFRGLDTFTPDEMLPPDKSPYLINWNSIERAGSWCARRGTGRMIDDGTTCVDSGAAPITSTYAGLAVRNLELNDPSDVNATHTCAQLLVFSNKGPGESAGNLNFCIVEPFVAWGQGKSLRNFPGPGITLSKPGALTLRVAANYRATMFTNRTGLPLSFIKGITIAWSGTRFPRDVDRRDDEAGDRVTLKADRASWNGTLTNFDITVPATGVYYVTVWAHSLEATSEPVYGRFEVT